MFTKVRSSFTLQVYCFAAGIACICLLLMALTWLQGPRVRSMTLDANLVTTTANQQLLLHMNHPPGSISEGQVKITPEAPFAVTSSGNTVAIQFTQPLRNNTDYKVTLQTSNKRYTIKHSFHTKTATFYYAVNSQYKTEIRKQTVGDNSKQVVYAGDKVDDYLALGNTLVLATKGISGNNLLLYDMASKQSRRVTLPGNGTISQLRSAPGKRTFGFIYADFTSNVIGNILLYDMNTQQLRRVELTRDRPAEASEWQFARSGATVLARNISSDTLLFSPGTVPIPLGKYTKLFGFSYDDSTILMRSATDGVIGLGIKNKQQRSLVGQTIGTYVNNVIPLSTKQGYIMQIPSPSGGAGAQEIVAIQKDEQKVLYTSTSADKYIDNVALSPNDQLLAIEERVVMAETHQSRIINSNDGHTLTTIEGNMVRWPSGL